MNVRFPKTPEGLTVLQIVIGDEIAVGVNTSVHDTPLPHSASPLHCWLWSKWGPTIADRYLVPTRLYDRFMPFAVGTGQFVDGLTDQTIGPEFSLAPKRLEELRMQCADPKQDVHVVTLKLASIGATASSVVEAHRNWNSASTNPSALINVLRTEYIVPALKVLALEGRAIYMDALYLMLGENDCLPTDALEEAPRALGENLRGIVDYIEEALDVESLPTVIALPRYNDARAPRARIELARQQLERWNVNDVRVHLQDIGDLAVQSDLVNLTPQAQIGLGHRFAHLWHQHASSPFPRIPQPAPVEPEIGDPVPTDTVAAGSTTVDVTPAETAD